MILRPRGRLIRLVVVGLLVVSSIASDPILYATNALSVETCTLHVLDPDSGAVDQDLGYVMDTAGHYVGIFGMCALGSTLYAVNHLDQLVRMDTDTAVVETIGSVGVNGLFDLACDTSSQSGGPRLYSFSADDSQLVEINPATGQGRLLPTEWPSTTAVSMDFDQGILWLLRDGKELSQVDLETGALSRTVPLNHGSLVAVDQRNGSIRNGTLYSAFFEANPSNLWQVDLGQAEVKTVTATGLDSAYALAFVDIQDKSSATE